MEEETKPAERHRRYFVCMKCGETVTGSPVLSQWMLSQSESYTICEACHNLLREAEKTIEKKHEQLLEKELREFREETLKSFKMVNKDETD